MSHRSLNRARRALLAILIAAVLVVLVLPTAAAGARTPVRPHINGAAFFDDTLGYAVGQSGTILKTINGGNTWTRLVSGTTATLRGVSFSDATHGVAVGDLGTILRTTNGGTSWVKCTSGLTSILYSVCLAPGNGNYGWAVGAYS